MVRYFRASLLSLILASFILLPAPAFSETKITLKNERIIIADYCEESGDKLICNMMGGSFEIEKKDIESLKEVTIIRQEEPRQEKPSDIRQETPPDTQQVESPPVQMQEPVETYSPDAREERRGR